MRKSFAALGFVVIATCANAADFGGRITLIPGQAYLGPADVTSNQIAYSPVPGGTGMVQIFDGVSMAPRSFLATPLNQNGPTFTLDPATTPANMLCDVFATLSGPDVLVGTAPCWNNQPSSFALIPNVGVDIEAGTNGVPWFQRANAFNGATSQPFASSAYIGATGAANTALQNYIGWDYGGSPQAVAKFILHAPNDDWLSGSGTSPALQITLDYSDDCTNWTNWLDNQVTPNVIGAAYPFVSGIWAGTHRCWRVGLYGDGSHRIKVGQLQFLSAVTTSREPLVFYGGVLVNAAPMALQTAGGPITCPQYGCTFLAISQIDATPGTISCLFSYGQNRKCGIANIANEANICLKAGEPTLTTQVVGASYQYPMTTQPRYVFSPSRGNVGNSLSILSPWPRRAFEVRQHQSVFINTAAPALPAAYWAAVGRDSQSQPCGMWGNNNYDNAGSEAGAEYIASCLVDPFAGVSKFTALEGSANNVMAGLGYNGTRGSMLLSACFPY